VFDGKKGNYKEMDTPNPLNVYAKTKYEGELEALKYDNSCIVRTNIYGYNWLPRNSIAEWIIKTLREGNSINLFKDVYFSPILVNKLAEILIEVIERRLSGIYHISSFESITKLEFGRLIAKLYNFNNDLIHPISIFDLNLSAPRPLNPTLNCSKIQKVIKSKILSIEEGLKRFKEIKTSYYLEYLKKF
ncbi:MAG: dTDP-4-dehydrorhamnose reductase family protein, partial [Promethearchaeota archaeon]